MCQFAIRQNSNYNSLVLSSNDAFAAYSLSNVSLRPCIRRSGHRRPSRRDPASRVPDREVRGGVRLELTLRWWPESRPGRKKNDENRGPVRVVGKIPAETK